jgi:hypothetical protein
MAAVESMADRLQLELTQTREALLKIEADRDARLAAAKKQLQDAKEKAKQMFLSRVNTFEKQIEDLEEARRGLESENLTLKDLLREADMRSNDADVRARDAGEKLVKIEERIRATVDDAVATVVKERDEARSYLLIRDSEVAELKGLMESRAEESKTLQEYLLSERNAYESRLSALAEELKRSQIVQTKRKPSDSDGRVDADTSNRHHEPGSVSDSKTRNGDQPLESDPCVALDGGHISLTYPVGTDESLASVVTRMDAAPARMAELEASDMLRKEGRGEVNGAVDSGAKQAVIVDLEVASEAAAERAAQLEEALSEKSEAHTRLVQLVEELQARLFEIEKGADVARQRQVKVEAKPIPSLSDTAAQDGTGGDSPAIDQTTPAADAQELVLKSNWPTDPSSAKDHSVSTELMQEALLRIRELEQSNLSLIEDLRTVRDATTSKHMKGKGHVVAPSSNFGDSVHVKSPGLQQQNLSANLAAPSVEQCSVSRVKVLEPKVAELERLLAAKQAEMGKVREKARAYLKDLNSEKREMETKLRAELNILEKKLGEERAASSEAKCDTERAVHELDNCLAVIAEKQKTIQALNMALASERTATKDARSQTARLSTEFESYKERARSALAERDSALHSASNDVGAATASLREQLKQTAAECDDLRNALLQVSTGSLKVADAIERAERAEAALEAVKSDASALTSTNARRIDELEEELERLRNVLTASESACLNAESRFSTTVVRLEVAERARQAAESSMKENSRAADTTIALLQEQITMLTRKVGEANASAASAQRTAAVAARAMAYSALEDEAAPSPSSRVHESPSFNSDRASSSSLPPPSPEFGEVQCTASFSRSSQRRSRGYDERRDSAEVLLSDVARDVSSRDDQIAVLMSQISELGAQLADAQEEYACREQQVALLKAEVRDLGAKLSAADKLSGGTPFELLRTTVLHYMHTGDTALLPALATVLGISEDEMARVRTANFRSANRISSGSDAGGYLPSFMRG